MDAIRVVDPYTLTPASLALMAILKDQRDARIEAYGTDVRCPICDAGATKPCVTLQGEESFGFHAERAVASKAVR